jgi:hypothetical protein
MNRCGRFVAAVACVAVLCGCAGPTIQQTSTFAKAGLADDLRNLQDTVALIAAAASAVGIIADIVSVVA